VTGTRTPESLAMQQRLAVFAGTGGVGKTTLAASFALEATRRGRRVALLTIDPARRLADALGAGPLGHEFRPIDPERIPRREGTSMGQLDAAMLDPKRTFDALVERFAASPTARDRVFQNPIYRHLSEALAGSAEYAAMERVHELTQGGDYDLIVLDTPPASHALDFLEAPRRMLALLESSVVQLLVHPAFAAGRLGFRLFHRSTQRVLQLIERLSGVGFLDELTEFLLAFDEMSNRFRAHAHRVENELRGPGTSFVLVAAPNPTAMRSGVALLDQLEERDVPLAGLVLNRTHPWPDPIAVERATGEGALERALGAQLPDDRVPAWAETARVAADRYACAARAEGRATRVLEERMRARGAFVCRVPEQAGEIHDLGALVHIAAWLFTDAGEKPA